MKANFSTGNRAVLCLAAFLLFGGCNSTRSGSGADGIPAGGNRNTVTFSYAETIPWDAVYDVVVVGFGGSGAITAITAADAGAKVLLTEKAPEGEEGGNTRFAGQHVVDYTSVEDGITYLKAVRGLFTNWPDEFIEMYVRHLAGFEKWWNNFGYTEYETRPRADYDLPAAESVIMYYTEIPGTPRFWVGLREQVMKRRDNIDVWFESPGKELIQDPYTKVVLGVKIETGGRLINVRARNGVVLATGGFENNQEMIQDYLQRPYGGALGGLYNTGDGIKMAQAVGAELWHMNATSGPYPAWRHPESGRGTQIGAFARNHAAIYVGPDGTRFLDESFSPQHGYKDFHGQHMTIPFPLPAWMIFDAASARDKVIPTWSEGNAEELARGYLKRADTLAALAAQIGVPSANLNSTVAEYNRYVAAGNDAALGRAPATLKAIGAGPYYALYITPSNLNTQGGPKRNLECEILDVWGKVIPNLYGVGELGSMHPGLYQGGGNLAECFVTGQIAGANAARAKPAPRPVTLETAVQSASFTYRAGGPALNTAANEYLGEGTGMGGAVTVKVTMSAGRISRVEIVSHHETVGIGDAAINRIPAAIVAANSADVDIVSGATLTSRAIITGVKDALSKAR
ncbi:MAG: FAD-binding protein [Spirochaetaceae bacterium]|jgi:uncharacterized protein with FMN-binding domain|nr:FAD-binding protein [Spirochaetaceae bacterium]